MMTWWQQLSLRERCLLGVAGTLLLIMLCYQLVWKPLVTGMNTVTEDVANSQQLLSWLQVQVPRIEQLRKTKHKHHDLGNQTILTVTEQSVRKSKVGSYVSAISLSTNNSVHIRFDKVPFDPFIDWLVVLEQQFGIVVENISISKDKAPGFVKVDVRLAQQ